MHYFWQLCKKRCMRYSYWLSLEYSFDLWVLELSSKQFFWSTHLMNNEYLICHSIFSFKSLTIKIKTVSRYQLDTKYQIFTIRLQSRRYQRLLCWIDFQSNEFIAIWIQNIYQIACFLPYANKQYDLFSSQNCYQFSFRRSWMNEFGSMTARDGNTNRYIAKKATKCHTMLCLAIGALPYSAIKQHYYTVVSALQSQPTILTTYSHSIP